FHEIALANERTRVAAQLALDQSPHTFDLAWIDRRRSPAERDDRHDAGYRGDPVQVIGGDTDETVPGKERPVDLPAPILPPAPAGHGREKRLESTSLEPMLHDVFVARSRPHRKPRTQHISRRCLRVLHPDLGRVHYGPPRLSSSADRPAGHPYWSNG